MKLKISYRPQQSMWLKKIISSGLALGLIFNNISVSLASVISEDGRYETFEGNNITIDNILEEDKVDVEIEGNTLVNSLNCNSSSDFSWLDGTLNEDGYIEIETDGLTYKNFFVKKEALIIKPSTMYTFFVEIAENTLTKVADTSAFGFIFGASHEANMTSLWTGNKSFSYNTKPGIYKFTLTTKDNFDDAVVGDRGFVNAGYSGKFKFRYMIIEGNHTDKNIHFFKGMKSVGQDSRSIKIKSQNKNLFDINNFKKMSYSYDLPFLVGDNKDFMVDGDTINYITPSNSWNIGVGGIYKVKKNTLYTAKYEESVCSKNFNMSINIIGLYEDELDIPYWSDSNYTNYSGRLVNVKATPQERNVSVTYNSKNYDYLSIYIGGNWTSNPIEPRTITLKNVGIYETGNNNISYERYDSFEKEILLNEPLRSLPNGVEDRIIKKNGQWVVERNCKEVTVDGSEEWIMVGDKKQNTAGFFTRDIKGITFENDFKSATPTLSNLFVSSNTDWLYTNDDNVEISYTAWDGNLCFSILKSKLSSVSVDGFKEWLSINNPRVIYQLPNPIYEPLNIDSTINLFLDTTHISNNSSIFANMKIVLDRTPNRAKEAIELIKLYPTIENLSNARYWTNLMKESILKDGFQDEINTNANIEELTIEKKTTTANVDLYIKPQNSLSMSLSTNSIIFDEFDSTEDMEKLNAIDITIESSLPYRLNSYLTSEIKNKDGSNIIPKEQFNIKLNGEVNYKAFNNINEKLVLKDDCLAGVNNIHSVDLILRGGKMNEADVYKTTLKFEAEQK